MTSINTGRCFMFRANGIPKGQPRARAFAFKGRARMYDPGTAEAWKSDIARACSPMEGLRLPDPIRLCVTFYFPRPKSHYRTNGTLKDTAPRLIHDQKPDIDNCEKAILDALTHIGAWIDDDQVCETQILKRWEQPGESGPGALITIHTLHEAEE